MCVYMYFFVSYVEFVGYDFFVLIYFEKDGTALNGCAISSFRLRERRLIVFRLGIRMENHQICRPNENVFEICFSIP